MYCPEHVAKNLQVAAPTAVGARQVAKPRLTYIFMGISLVIYVLQTLLPVFNEVVYTYAIYYPIFSLELPWTFLTSGFLHGGIAHLLLNLYALYLIGQYLERTLGHWRYASIYLLSVIGGHTAVLLLADPLGPSWVTGTVGASGAVFGLFGALFVVQRKMGAQAAQVIVLIAINFAFSFLMPNISWQGHLGGFITGLVAALLFFALRPKRYAGADLKQLARRSATMHSGLVIALFLIMVSLIIIKMYWASALGAPVPIFWI